MESLSIDVLFYVMDFAWRDGSLDPREARAIMDAATQSGVSHEDFERLADATRGRSYRHDIRDLSRDEALLAYGLATWVALADEGVNVAESTGLDAFAGTLGLSAADCERVGTAVWEARGASGAIDLAALRQAIEDGGELGQD